MLKPLKKLVLLAMICFYPFLFCFETTTAQEREGFSDRGKWQGSEIPTQSGWILISGKSTVGPYTLFRKYAITPDGVPNLIIFNCSNTDNSPYSHLTFIIPKSFPLKFFRFGTKNPSLKITVEVDFKRKAVIDADLDDNEIYIDRTPDSRTFFNSIMEADDIKLDLNAKGDSISYHLMKKVDDYLASDQMKASFENMGKVISYSREQATKACDAVEKIEPTP